MSGAESQGRNACPSLPKPVSHLERLPLSAQACLPSGTSPTGLLFLRLCAVPAGSLWAAQRGALSLLEAAGVVVETLRGQESKHIVANKKWGS